MLKKIIAVAGALLLAGAIAAQSQAGSDPKNTGEQLFKDNCSACHPDGGNIINPAKTLKKADRSANGVKTAADIMKKMRNPGPGMSQFDKKTIPDKDAKKIAEYILKTFN